MIRKKIPKSINSKYKKNFICKILIQKRIIDEK